MPYQGAWHTLPKNQSALGIQTSLRSLSQVLRREKRGKQADRDKTLRIRETTRKTLRNPRNCRYLTPGNVIWLPPRAFLTRSYGLAARTSFILTLRYISLSGSPAR